MERLNSIVKPEIIHKPRYKSTALNDESRIERLVLRQKKDPEYVPTFEIKIAQRADGLWFWAISCYTDDIGCSYGLFDDCGEYVRNRQDAINAAALEIVDCYKGHKLNNNCIKWLLDITQRSDSQDTLF